MMKAPFCCALAGTEQLRPRHPCRVSYSRCTICAHYRIFSVMKLAAIGGLIIGAGRWPFLVMGLKWGLMRLIDRHTLHCRR